MAQPMDRLRPRHGDARGVGSERRTRPGTTRVPPHNLEAEESLLGAMLLSRDAIATGVELVHADDFYKPAHGHVYEAITSLWAQGEPADPVTVAEALRRADLLEAIGGPALLVSLQAGTPATTNAARYARIVEEHALLRRLIGVAADIAEMGYELPEDVPAAIDAAEAMVFEVAERRVIDSMRPLRELLGESLDHLEMLYERGEAITGVPTGFVDLDHRLAGLQPSNLVIVGARPAMGKALALDTPLPTPTGWTTMGEVRAGDEVFDEAGHPCRVVYTSPVFTGRRCYEVRFDDGTSVVADADHNWFAYDLAAWTSKRKHPRVVTTEQMIDEGLRRYGRPNWYVPLAGDLDLLAADLHVDPYALGCCLSDGTGRGTQVPLRYLRASSEQRLALLQGLMDTHGHIQPNQATVELGLANLPLLEDAWELVCSLGQQPGPIRHQPVKLADGRLADSWRFRWVPTLPVFRLARKALRQTATSPSRRNRRWTRRSVAAITEVPSVPTRCIAVDSESHLFLAGRGMTPTHNTALALGMAAHAAVQAHIPVLFFSLEMSHPELTQRLLCADAKVDATRMRNGKLREDDWPKISHAVGRLAEAPIFIDDNPHLSVLEIRSKARRLKSRHGLGLIVVDYLQLMTGRNNVENRQVEISEISRSLKILARELELPVIALSQLSRNLESRQDKRPMLSDLRESGSLEQDADVVMFIYRDEMYNAESTERGAAEVIVAKHRNGPTGTTSLAFNGTFTRFDNLAPRGI